MDRTCEFYESCGMEFCTYDIECPHYQRKMKPVIFSAPMQKAIDDDLKTQTRRVIKPKYSNTHFKFRTSKYGTEFVEMQNDVEGETFGKTEDGKTWHKLLGYVMPNPKYKQGDILYVLEAWRVQSVCFPLCMTIEYRSDGTTSLIEFDPMRFEQFYKFSKKTGWQSPYFMPKEAARKFLKVKDVKPEQLNDITEEDAMAEGTTFGKGQRRWTARSAFMDLWDSLNAKRGYSWESNPWVWVYEFEKCEKPGGAK